jgi:hypothetical protein
VLWGLLHGIYLLVNHAWRTLGGAARAVFAPVWASRLVTFLCVAFAWVLFRSDNLTAARAVYAGLFGLNGIVVSPDFLAALGYHHAVTVLGLRVAPGYFENVAPWHIAAWCAAGFAIVWYLPNSMEVSGFAPAPLRLAWLRFRMLPGYAIANALLLFVGVSVINSGAVSEFIYYRF